MCTVMLSLIRYDVPEASEVGPEEEHVFAERDKQTPLTTLIPVVKSYIVFIKINFACLFQYKCYILA